MFRDLGCVASSWVVLPPSFRLYAFQVRLRVYGLVLGRALIGLYMDTRAVIRFCGISNGFCTALKVFLRFRACRSLSRFEV